MVAQLYHLGERMEVKTSMKTGMDVLTSQLHEEKDRVLALEKHIKGLKLKLRNQDEAGVLAVSGEHLYQRAAGEKGGGDMRAEGCCGDLRGGEVYGGERCQGGSLLGANERVAPERHRKLEPCSHAGAVQDGQDDRCLAPRPPDSFFRR